MAIRVFSPKNLQREYIIRSISHAVEEIPSYAMRKLPQNDKNRIEINGKFAFEYY